MREDARIPFQDRAVAGRALGERLAGMGLVDPVAPPETVDALRAEVDDIVCLAQPEPFGAIGYFYLDFHQLADDEVVALMKQAPRAASTEHAA